MKRLIPSIVFAFALLLLPGLAWAQQGTITGTVTEAETADPLPGATVQVPDLGTGAAAGSDGQYRITGVPAGEQTLRVSFVGFQAAERTVTVPAGGTVRANFQLQSSQAELEEVVVTALGIEEEQKRLGYATSEVQGGDIAETAEANLADALSGQVAGLRVRNSSGQPGSATRITLRGNSSYSEGGNSPLIVLDGTIISNAEDDNPRGPTVLTGGTTSRLLDIDPNSIKNVNVLKGASATALYGSRAANGAIVITTKDGTGIEGDGLSASFTSSVGYSDAIVQGYQDEYLQGRDGAFANGELFGKGGYNEAADPNSPNFNPDADPTFTRPLDSWGPHKDSVSQAVVDSVGQPQDVNPRDQFYDEGIRTEQSLTVSGSGDFGNASATVTYLQNDGIVPTAQLSKTTVQAKYSANLTDSFGLQASANYSDTGRNFMTEGNGPRGYRWDLLFHPINFDLEPIQYEDGTKRRHSAAFVNDNPFWIARRSDIREDVRRFIGSLQLSYDLADWLTVKERIGIDTYDQQRKQKVNSNTTYEPNGFTYKQALVRSEINSDFTISINEIGLTDDLSFNAVLGNNISRREFADDYIQGRGIGAEDFFNVSNFSTTTQSETSSEQVLIGAFARGTFNFRDYAFLSLSARNDWSSTLPKSDRSYFYPGADLSFIFTEAFEGVFEDIPLSYGKLRLNVSQVGNDTDPYQLETTFSQANPSDGVRGNIQYPFRGVNGFALENTRANPNLKPEITTEYEVGTDLRFFGGRATLGLTYYTRTTEDQIFDVPTSGATGFSSQSRNAGSIKNEGWEVDLGGTPLQIGDFSWDLNVNWSKNTTTVEELAPGVESIFLAGFTSIQIRAEEGEDGYGGIFGSRYLRNGMISEEESVVINGQERTSPLEGFSDDALIINSDGTPVQASSPGITGNVQPDWESGIRSTFSWKGLSLSQQWQISQGADILNFDAYYAQGSGTWVGTEDRGTEVTKDGIQVDTGEENQTSFVKDQDWYEGADRFVFERYVEDASYVKLQQVSLSYRFTLPDRLSQASGLSSIHAQVSGRNLLTFTDFTMGDPQGSIVGSGNGQGFYHMTTPTSRTYRASLTLNF